PTSYDKCPRKKKRIAEKRQEGHRKMEVDIRRMLPPTKDCQALSATTRGWKRQEGVFPRASGGTKFLLTP
ncbi:hypothetical protein KQ772_15080, partial [Listeria monocytogenes]|nr:hypothetical protein [Listeria monocytogenes]